MKKIVLIVSCFSLTFAGDMGLSMYGGALISNATVECEVGMECNGLTSGSFGVQYNMQSVVVGVGVSIRGYGMSMEMLGMETKLGRGFTYLDLSAIYPYKLGPGNAWAGLGIGLNLAASETVDMSGSDDMCAMMECGETTTDLEDVPLDYGLLLGYTYPVNDNMGIYASYYMGLAEIEEGATWSGIGLGITYGLPF